jgi:hypothetical protein
LLDRIGTPKSRAKRFCERKCKPTRNFRFGRFGERHDTHEQNSKIPEHRMHFARRREVTSRKTILQKE